MFIGVLIFPLKCAEFFLEVFPVSVPREKENIDNFPRQRERTTFKFSTPFSHQWP